MSDGDDMVPGADVSLYESAFVLPRGHFLRSFVSAPRVSALVALYRKGPMNISSLVKYITIPTSYSYVHKLIRILSGEGYIASKNTERGRILSLTEKGRKVAAAFDVLLKTFGL